MKKRSEFDKWFVAQFGKRPSNKTSVALHREAMEAAIFCDRKQTLRDVCNLWDEQRQAARYAYNAFRKDMEKGK